MLTITIPGGDVYNEETHTFETINSCTLKLEHSLLSLYKWESKHHTPFLDNDHTNEEILDYIKCMTTNQVDERCYDHLSFENVEKIKKYIEDPMTATTFYDPFQNEGNNSGQKEIVTAEVIYSSMIILGIPIDIFEKRHLNHLITLIKVCKEKQDPDAGKNKVSQGDIMRHYSEVNKARRAAAKAKGK